MKWFFGMMNIGNRPTVNGENQTIEVHFFNFNKEIYDHAIEVSLLHFIREEQKFSSLDQLKSQIAKDQIFSLDYISKLQ